MPSVTSSIELPSPAPGTEQTLRVHRYGAPGARPKAYFQAALHADEIPGLLVAQHLLRG
ncbi:MAG: succinylglutamate desuccinylase/aspartoacylase family protein, partial [Proteobacteria bacterium]|nr:succinylglutamate desuccinylase/aspartoacylase family protein [Pseudomonadota bacterium]